MQIRILSGSWRVAFVVAISGVILAPSSAVVPAAGGGNPPDRKANDVRPILYPRPDNNWPFSSGPVYGTVDVSRWSAAGVLHTQVGSFDLTRGMPNIPNELRAVSRLGKQGSQHFLMQVRPEAFADGSFDALKRTIVAEGGSIVGEMPVAAFLVRMTPRAHDAIKSSPSIIALQPYQPAFKLSPEIGRVPLLDAAKAVSSVYSLKVQLFPGESTDAAAASLLALGVHVKGSYSDTIIVDADRSTLGAIAALDPVYMIEEVLPVFLMSEETSTTVQTGKWNNGATPYTDAGVDGGGLDKSSQSDDQILMILDNGIQLDAGDLSNTSTDPGLDVNGLPVAGHRKVAFYGTTAPFGGSGDLLGCDNSTTSGVTHGHTVAAVALGNATNVPVSYGSGFHGVDPAGNFWGLDGVAPRARLVAYDGQVTPQTGRCDDVTMIPTPVVGITPLDPGDLSTLLPDGYAKGARVINFSWGSVANTYDVNAQKIDAFLATNSDALVFVAAGNAGRDKNLDGFPDSNTVGAPASAKNILCVGASLNADDLDDPNRPNSRWTQSSNGPATVFSNRIAPLLMAPGADGGTLGLVSEFHCRSNDNDQNGPVECDVVAGQISTSFASAAAAGAGLVVRDYFAQGFYPDGTNANAGNAADQVPTISGALLKAVLVTSAEWMHAANSNLPLGPALTRKYRGNREQGFGRIVLTNALPLQSYPGAVSGLIVGDGGPAPAGLVNSTTLDLNLASGSSTSHTLNVCDTSQPLKVAIAWMDPSVNDQIVRDLDLELMSPSGRVYLGNFFTDDTNGDGALSGTEECTYTGQPWPPDSLAGIVDTGPWSLPSNTCAVGAHVDHNNNVEAVFLSPDSRLNGIADDLSTPSIDEAADNQVEQGAWTVTVRAAATNSGAQNYSIALAGGVCAGSAARIRRVLPSNQLEGSALSCNDSVVATVDEVGTAGDPVAGLTTAEIASRTTVEVVNANGVVTDTETLASGDFTLVSSAGNNLRFDSRKILLTDGTAPESGNGALDVRDGQSVRVVYQDESPNGTPDPNARRIGLASVRCRPAVASGNVVFAVFGKDAATLVTGGCERDARGYFTFGFPDRYMDAGELVSYTVAFQSTEASTDLTNAAVSLRAVMADANSPANCKPGSTPTVACPDPNRTDNPPCPYLTVLDTPKVFGLLPAGSTITPSFTVKMAAAIPGTQKVDMLVGVTSQSMGRGVESLIAQREVLNADEFALFYSTDFPLGGAEPVGGYDVNNNEILETVTTDPRSFTKDYVFETRAYADMTATNPLASIKAPWNFDTNNGGFISGLQNSSRPSLGTFAQWGEDKNFNGKLDGFCTGDTTISCTQGDVLSVGCSRCSGNLARACSVDLDCQLPPPNEGTCQPKGTCDFSLGEDRNPMNGSLDSSWNTLGGCGWQTKAPADTTGGAWHTGLIQSPGTGTCLVTGGAAGDCQRYWAQPDGDLVGDNNWWELLLTPVLHKVNQGVDGSGDPIYQVSITDWAWDMSLDIPDVNTSLTLEFDTDLDKSAGVDLFGDMAVLASLNGRQGAVSGGRPEITGGFSMFARVSNCQDTDGNGSLDHCGTAAGRLCNSNKLKPDFECGGGVELSPTRGLCANPAAPLKCTGNPNLNCTTDAQCNQRCSLDNSRSCQNPAQTGSTSTSCTTPAPAAGICQDNVAVLGLASPAEKCVPSYVACTNDTDCGGAPGSCVVTAGTNRGGSDNCSFLGVRSVGAGSELVLAQEPYGLATPPDDDAANGYCNRNDGLNGIDKSVSCTGPLHCDAAGGPYASVRACSLRTSVTCTANANCGTCSLNSAHACTTSADCLSGEGTCTAAAIGTCTTHLYDAVCTKPDSVVDEYVQGNGPGRNYGIRVASGLDMRLTQLEDFYGDTGTAFRAALGFNNREPDVNTLGIPPGLGVAVDDMVISWKETRLDEDTHDCASGGECATVESSSTVSYEGSSVLQLTVTDRSPYDAVNNRNDCNGDGDYVDATDDQDCNDNGTLDVTVKLTSDAEPSGEIAVLDQIAPGSPVYKGNFPYSMLYDSPGSLFVTQTGAMLPTVRARYEDRDDGTGTRCNSAVDPANRGFVYATTTIATTTGRIVVSSYAVRRVSTCSIATGKQCITDADCLGGEGTCLPTYGDDDGFADANELINLPVVFANKSGVDVDDLTATLGTTSPNIECVNRSIISIGALAKGALSDPATYFPFQFKVANVNRSTATQVLQAKFTITVRSNRFEALTRATEITLDLDLNVSAGGAPSPSLFEDFEAGFGKFTLEFLDANKASVAKSDTFRCQYNDPLGINSQSVGNRSCFLGFTSDPASGVNDWHVHTSTASTMGVGRAFTGKQSLHMGVHGPFGPSADTTRLRHIMSIRTSLPVSLGPPGSTPELNFAQQVSFVDNSSGIEVSQGEVPDRGVVEAQLAVAGVASGPWIKLYPYANVYDQQGTDDFSSCLFDPTDDGNNEDSYFDPSDPGRRLGSSSTCFPEFVFARQGQTDHSKSFNVNDVGLASDGPGLQACSSPPDVNCLPPNTTNTINNPGTWVRTRFSLAQFAGRTIRLRFLFSSFDFDGRGFWSDWFGGRDVSADDGWYIDDIHVDGAVSTPMTVSPDSTTIASPLPCSTCSAVTPVLSATPGALAAPGQIVTLSAMSSTADACPSGVLQFQFWNNADGNGAVGDVADILLRDWSDNSSLVDAPMSTTQYGVRTRCSTNASCDSASNTALLVVPVTCPSLSSLSVAAIKVNKPGAIITGWGGNLTVRVIRGDLSALRSSGGVTNVNAGGCLANDTFVSSVTDAAVPAPGAGVYYLVRSPSACNVAASGSFSEGLADELPGSGGNRDVDIAGDPDSCP